MKTIITILALISLTACGRINTSLYRVDQGLCPHTNFANGRYIVCSSGKEYIHFKGHNYTVYNKEAYTTETVYTIHNGRHIYLIDNTLEME